MPRSTPNLAVESKSKPAGTATRSSCTSATTASAFRRRCCRRVFDLFVQSRQAVDRSQGGLGLGLTIVRTMVELHGGSVEARSDGAGRGSEFVIRLPAAQACRPPTSRPRSARRPARSPSGHPRPRRRRQPRRGVDARATRCGRSATRFGPPATVRAALAIAAEFQPQVVLLDLGLPVMDGYEVAERLRALGHAAADRRGHRIRPGSGSRRGRRRPGSPRTSSSRWTSRS